jgi:hypothetical protein
VPQFGHTRCDSLGAWHCGHSLTLGADGRVEDRRASRRALEVFLLGTAISSSLQFSPTGNRVFVPYSQRYFKGTSLSPPLRPAFFFVQLEALQGTPSIVHAFLGALAGPFIEVLATDAAEAFAVFVAHHLRRQREHQRLPG